jgi:hypothetical protein
MVADRHARSDERGPDEQLDVAAAGSSPDDASRGARQARELALVAVPLVAAFALCVSEGLDHPYPGVALGSGALLLVERALALWAGWLFVLAVVRRAWAGLLPHERARPQTPPQSELGSSTSAAYPTTIMISEQGGLEKIDRDKLRGHG